MENLDNIGKNSLEALSRDNLTEKGKKIDLSMIEA